MYCLMAVPDGDRSVEFGTWMRASLICCILNIIYLYCSHYVDGECETSSLYPTDVTKMATVRLN